VTGEHGVGVEKLKGTCAQFQPNELERFHDVKAAFDVKGCSPGQGGVPTLARCAEFGKMHVHRGQIAHPDIPRSSRRGQDHMSRPLCPPARSRR